MKNISFFLLATLFVFTPTSTHAAQYYECAVSFDPSVGEACEAYRGRVHMCQLYNWTYTNGMPSHCSDFCLNRSGIPEECATVVVRQSNFPEKHEGRGQVEDALGVNLDSLKGIEGAVRDKLSGIENEINTEDGISEEEVQYVAGKVVGAIREILGEKVGETVGGIKDKVKDVLGGGDDDEDLEELTEEDFMDHSIEGTQLNEYRSEKWPDENGTKIAKIIDPYGKERYTSDGKHFYDNAYDAAHSGEGISNMVNSVSDTWENFTDFFSFKTKLKDKDKELQREIAREVLKDAKGQREKDIEKAYEKLSGKISTPKFGDVPAKTIITLAKETNETDFAEGAMLYIEQRKEGKSQANIRENFSEELSGGYATFRGGVALGTTSKYAEGVLYARYEEAYQRYKLAQEFGRTE